MAKSISSSFLTPLFLSFLCLSCYGMKAGNANNNSVVVDDHEHDDGSLVPKRPCNRSTIAPEANRWRGKASAIVVNRWSGMDEDSIPTEDQILEWDAQRAKSIQARFTAQRIAPQKEEPPRLKVLPGSAVGSPSFVVQVGIGKPISYQYLLMDTGSQITWLQCKGCEPNSCFEQKTSHFDPIASRSMKVNCGSVECKMMLDSKYESCKKVKSPPCEFTKRYEDGSSVHGDIYKDVLTLGDEVVSNHYAFGCANTHVPKTSKSFVGSSGIIGLQGGDPESLIAQLATKFHSSFTYCLPTGKDNYGYLTFGPSSNASPKARFTLPIQPNTGSEYFVKLTDISVGAKRLNLASEFSGNALIDSGTVLSRLPKAAFEKLEEEFIKQMGKKYPQVPGGPNKACYNLLGFPGRTEDLPIPKISLHFNGDSGNEAIIPLSNKAVMGGKWERHCLFFAPNASPDDHLSIIGGYTQQTMEFEFDLNKQKITIGPQGCK